MSRVVVFCLIVTAWLIIILLLVHLFKVNRKIKEDLLGILRLNSRNYLKLFVGMANKKDFNQSNMIALIKHKFNNLYSDYKKADKDIYILERAIDVLEYGILILYKGKNIYYINGQLGKLLTIDNIKVLQNKDINDTQLRWILKFNYNEVFDIPREYSSCDISCYMEKLDENLTIYTFKNITDVKKLDTMSTDFISNITHELKTPLTSIMGFAETLKTVEDEEDRQMFYDIISKEAIRLNNLISDVLIFSEIETQNDSSKQKIDILGLLYNIKLLLTPQLESQKFIIDIVGDKINVLGNEKYFRQIFINIIDNSIKHSFGDYLRITCTQDEQNIYMEFYDNGIGIPADEIENIFDRFYKVSKSKTKSRGTGLGLSIVKSSLNKVGGELNVFNNEDKGVTFRLIIPKNKSD